MEKYRAIPPGYMTVGELARKMNTTVRTLQYYDKEGVLSPSAVSEGGRRLYTDADIVMLHQIQALKQLGFSLDDIKNRLVSLDSPSEVAKVLTLQAKTIRERIESLSESLDTIEKLKAEVLQMQSVNFKRYADIIVNLQMKNEFYWIIKNFDDETLDGIRNRFDNESGREIMVTFKQLFRRAIKLKNSGISPDSVEGIELAEQWWEMVMTFTGGDMSLLPGLMNSAENPNGSDSEWGAALEFLEPAMGAYFTKTGENPFEGVEK